MQAGDQVTVGPRSIAVLSSAAPATGGSGGDILPR